MAPDGENFRGINAVRVLGSGSNYTLDKVITAGWDKRLSFFEKMVPTLLKAYDALPQTDTLKAVLQAPIAVLRAWDYNSGEASVATTLAIEWVTKLLPKILHTRDEDDDDVIVEKTHRFATQATFADLLPPLAATIKELAAAHGTWQVPWGEINRFQRLNDDIDSHYNDNQPSLPDGFASSQWGQLPSYAGRYFPGTKKRYGVTGNSFICAVQFGKKIQAKSLLAGGESGNIHSPHFTDQALMYTQGQFKDVLFYKDDVLKHVEREYRPGE